MPDIAIVIRGGTFQEALSDSPGDRIVVVDHDDQAAGDDPPTFSPIPHAPLRVAEHFAARVSTPGQDDSHAS